MYYLLILALVAADQASKAYIRSCMMPGDSIPVISQVFHITYVQNAGAAFSILQGEQLLLKVLPIAVIVGMVLYLQLKGKKEHWSLRTAFSLIVAGGIGNLIDRIRFGFVVDFFDFRVFPVFNIADIAVCTGCGFLILYVLFFEKSGKGGIS